MSQSLKTVGFVLKASAEFLEQRCVPNPRLTSEHLLARLLGCKRLDLYMRSDAPLAEPYLEAMRRGIRRAAEGEPAQYIMGQWDFMGHTFKVDKRALIPRPETEVLVQHVVNCEELWSMPTCCIADVGVGSGCIVISLALAHPKGVYVGLDISEDAISLARENAEALGVTSRIAFVQAELSDAVEPESLAAVVSNPPYIPAAQYAELSRHIKDYEPRIALEAGEDGMNAIRTIVQDSAIALRTRGLIFMEIGDRQAADAAAVMESAGFKEIVILPDLAGKDRIVTARLAD